MARRHKSISLFLCLILTGAVATPCCGMINVGELDKAKARDKYGITMHARRNGTAGVKVWLEFRRQGWLEKFTYAELRVNDENGKHRLSVRLQPGPVRHKQPDEITSVAFSAQPDELKHCRFLVVCYGSNEGDVGYYLDVDRFIDLEKWNVGQANPAPQPWKFSGRIISPLDNALEDMDVVWRWSANGNMWNDQGRLVPPRSPEEITELWNEEGHMEPWAGRLAIPSSDGWFEFTVTKNSTSPRVVLAMNRERTLGGMAVADPNNKQPVLISLQPLVHVHGRIHCDSKVPNWTYASVFPA